MTKWVVFLFVSFFSNSNPQPNQFYLFNGSNSPLNVTSLWSLAIDSSDVIWIGAQDVLYKYDHGNWELIDTLLQLPGGWVSDIEISSGGDILFCVPRGLTSNYNKLYSYNDGWINLPPYQIVDPVKLFIDESDNLWVTFYNVWPHQLFLDVIEKYAGSDWEVIDRLGMSDGDGDLAVRNDTIFVTTAFGFYKYADSIWQIVIPPEEWSVEKIWKYQQRMWIGGEKFGEFYGDTFAPIEPITNFLDSTNSNSTSLNVEDKNILWIGTNNGHIIRFEDSLEVVTEYAGNEVIDIEIDKYNNKWMLINNIGLLIYNEDGILEVQSSSDFTVSGYSLSQNYPNPFNPTTKIRFTIPNVIATPLERGKQSQLVTLKVYDILGNNIATLVYEEKPAGEYEVEFNSHSDEGQNLPSGVYFYQLRIGGPEINSGQAMIQKKWF